MTQFDIAHDSIRDLYASEKYQECEEACRFVLSIQSSNPTGLYFMGKLNHLNGDAAAAAQYYRRLALIFPFNDHYTALALETQASTGGISTLELEKKIDEAKASIAEFPHRPALRHCKNPVGEFVVPAHPANDRIANSICEGKMFEPEIIEVAKRYIKPGSAAIDVGANLGQMTLAFSDMVGQDGRVYSIEADDYLHHVINTNLSLNHRSNVVAVCAAVHSRDGEKVYFPEQDFIEYHTYGAYGLDPSATSGRLVITKTIDSLKIDLPVSFMKVDVQGADLFALRGAVKTIAKYQFPIIFEYEEEFQERFGTTFQDYVVFVTSINYKFAYTVKDINFVIIPSDSPSGS